MKLIAGLGNPGNRYRFTRHNFGFLVVDQLAENLDIVIGQKGFDACFGKGKIEATPVLLVKPQIFMNLSGIAVKKISDYYRIGIEDIIIIHDDLDLSFSTVRLKAGGGDGGHKGLISITECLGSKDFTRVRMGIGKPVHKGMVEGYVLDLFTREEAEMLPAITELAGDAIGEIISSGVRAAMNKYHGTSIKNFSEEV